MLEQTTFKLAGNKTLCNAITCDNS